MINLKVLPLILLTSIAAAQILEVPNGGTGNPTLTQHGPLVGNGANAITALDPGIAGQCLISGGPSIDPVFAACPGGAGGGMTPPGSIGIIYGPTQPANPATAPFWLDTNTATLNFYIPSAWHQLGGPGPTWSYTSGTNTWSTANNITFTGTVTGAGGGAGNLPSTATIGSVLAWTSAAGTWAACPPGTTYSLMTWNASGGCPVNNNQFLASGATFQSTLAASNLIIQGGANGSVNSALGGLTLQGADQTGAGGVSSSAGRLLLRGGNNTSTNVASLAGSIGAYGGASTGAANTGHQGFRQAGQYFLKSGIVTQWNLQQAVGAESTSDAVASPAQVLGVAQGTGAVAILVVDSGEVPVNASAAVTAGHTVCATGPTVTDSGGPGACSSGFLFGVVTRTSGAYTLPDGSTVTLSATLPAVRIIALTGSSGTAGGGAIPAATMYDSMTHGWGSNSGTISATGSNANAISGQHFRYGVPYDTAFHTLGVTFNTASNTDIVYFAIYDITTPSAPVLACQTNGTNPASGTTFEIPCAQPPSPRLVSGHDYVFLKSASVTTTTMYGMISPYIFSRYVANNVNVSGTICTLTQGVGAGTGITCSGTFPALGSYANGGPASAAHFHLE